jgi:hypothetical protein
MFNEADATVVARYDFIDGSSIRDDVATSTLYRTSGGFILHDHTEWSESGRDDADRWGRRDEYTTMDARLAKAWVLTRCGDDPDNPLAAGEDFELLEPDFLD